jgi:hypothetical protein
MATSASPDVITDATGAVQTLGSWFGMSKHGAFFMTGNHYPQYEIFPVKSGGWYVLIIREDGQEENWVGFASKAEAQAWINKEIAKRPQIT